METASILVFDLDDTLYPEAQFVRSGMDAVGRELARRFARPEAPRVLREVQDEGIRGQVFDVALQRLALEANQELVTELVGVYREHEPELALYPDARALLAALEGRALAMVTDGWERVQRRKLAALGLVGRFTPLICTFDRDPQWRKPSRLAFDEIARHHGGPPERFVYVADNPGKDFGGPAAAGWRTVCVRRPDGVHAGVADAGHRIDLVLDDLSQLLEVLG